MLARAGHAAGTPFSAAHTFAQTGPFRPRNLVRGTGNAVLAAAAPPRRRRSDRAAVRKLAAARITGGPRRPRVPLTATQEASA
ncbi:hypothetical protein GCM10023238_39760 [Streptomyces heliomycini]